MCGGRRVAPLGSFGSKEDCSFEQGRTERRRGKKARVRWENVLYCRLDSEVVPGIRAVVCA